jgi:AcrR family transcriptional regulator
MKSEHNTNESTKFELAEACKACMHNTPVENITVKQICDQSHLSRQTFYRCFLDKYDLINWYFDHLLQESFSQMGSGKTIQEGLILKFRYIQQEYVFFRAAFSNDTQNNLQQHDFEMIFAFYQNLIRKKNAACSQEILDILEMYCWASIYMTVKWVMQEMPKTPEELTGTMIAAMPKELSDLFKKLKILA